MDISGTFVSRIKALIQEGSPISYDGKRGYAYTYKEHEAAEGWLTSAANVVFLIVSDPLSPYRRRADQLTLEGQLRVGKPRGVTAEQVGAMIGLLESLLKDCEAGLIGGLMDRARAGIFDDFLDHAIEYLRAGRKEAGVIAGAVFEDTIRRIAAKHSVIEPSLDSMITAFAKRGVFTEVKAKRARSAADVRNKASHAQWADFDLSDIQNCITFTREIISAHLG